MVLALVGASSARAQEPAFERLQLDRLQLVSLGAGAGSIAPSQVVPTTIYALASDYGEISPAWRLILRISYWDSRFKESVVKAFTDTLQNNLVNPSATQ